MHIKWVNYLQEFHFILKHKFDAQNRAMDMLSKTVKLLGVLCMEVIRFDTLKYFYASDPDFGRIL